MGFPRSVPRFLVISAAMSIMTAGFTACGRDGSAPTSEPQSTTSVPATTTTTIAGESLFGWLRSFEANAGTITIGVDEAEMFTGEEALAAAREDGAIDEDEELPNDFYIRNPDESTIDLTVSPAVVVTLQACYEGGECVTTEQVDLNMWSVLLGGEDDPGLAWDWYGSGTLPYEFILRSGVIVEAEEQYLP